MKNLTTYFLFIIFAISSIKNDYCKDYENTFLKNTPDCDPPSLQLVFDRTLVFAWDHTSGSLHADYIEQNQKNGYQSPNPTSTRIKSTQCRPATWWSSPFEDKTKLCFRQTLRDYVGEVSPSPCKLIEFNKQKDLGKGKMTHMAYCVYNSTNITLKTITWLANA